MTVRSSKPVTCWHRSRHEHGTLAGYRTDGCGCGPCTKANARYNKAYRLARQRGAGDYLVDPTDALAVIETLRGRGLSLERIAAIAGVSQSTLVSITTGSTKKLRPTTTRKLLALRCSEVTGRVDATASVRRLRGLAALGWTAPAIASACGLSSDTVRRILHGKRTTLRANVADAITAASERIGDRAPAPHEQSSGVTSKARAAAAAQGWLVPAWWDDDTIADPTVCPDITTSDDRIDIVLIRRVVNGESAILTRGEQTEVVRVLNANGSSDPEIADRLALHPRTILRIRQSNGIKASA